MRKKIKYNKHLFLIILATLSFIPLFDLLHPGLPITHDGQDHVARIANFYQNLTDGNIIPRWAPNLNWGYGHPILIFLYPLSSYVASVFHFLGFSLVDSVKIVFGLGMIGSGIAMYIWLSAFLGKMAGFVGGILYVFVPYRFVDLYVRGAIGEHMAFIFLPLILYFILKLSKKYSKWYIVGGSLSVTGLILAHNAISLMFLPLIFLHALFYLFASEKKRMLAYYYAIVLVLGFGLSSFFWMPAFFEGKYTLRDIVTDNDYSLRFVRFTEFIYDSWSYGGTEQLSKQVGIIQWFVTILGIPIAFLMYTKKNKLWILTGVTLAIFWITLFIMTPMSLFLWDKITILQKFQFPWRFLSIAVFATAFLGAVVISAIPKNLKVIAICFLLIAVLFFNKDYWHSQGYLHKPESFFTGIYYGTTDTGESAPIWSVRFMLEEPKAPMEVIEGSAKIKQLKRSSTSRLYAIDASSKSRLRENTLYFPGWEVYVDGMIVKNVEFQDPANRGLITFFVDKGKHMVYVKFGETKLRAFADIISVVTLVIIIFLSGIRKRKEV